MKRADAICTAYAGSVQADVTPRTYGAIVAWTRKMLPLYEAALQKLEALEPPSKDAAAVQSWLAADRRVARSVRQLGDAAERRDFPAVSVAASRAQLAGSESRRAASALGMRVCAHLVTGR